ncbi:MAG: hypothetical protein EOP09_04095 [Proteobacteria bacterium]|nr:MAG: hypothetical protein EOP09_04095 [Pseudomonadota bacterium]
MLTERRTVSRVGLGLDSFKEATTAQVFRVLEISPTGFSIELFESHDGKKAHPFQVGQIADGEMKLFDRRISIQAECRYALDRRAGFRMVPGNNVFEDAFARLQDPEVIGQSLKPIPAERLEITFEGVSGSFAVFDREQDGSIHRFEIGVLEHAVAWSEGDELRTFRLQADVGPTRTSGTWISRQLDSRHHWVEDESVNRETLEFIKRLFSQAKIEGRLKSIVQRQFADFENRPSS